jgi:hypothetical protein
VTPRKDETYFYQGRPITVIKVDKAARRALVRAGNVNPKLDIWVTWGELT